jgi:hypothetical protein
MLRAPSHTQNHAKNGAQDDDERRIDRLVPGAGCWPSGKKPPSQRAVGVVERERVERRALLLEAAPEEDGAEEEYDDHAYLLLAAPIESFESST